MRILHVTDAAAAGVLAAVSGLARAQSVDPAFDRVEFAYTPRPESPHHAEIVERCGDSVPVQRWSNAPRTALWGLIRGLWSALRSGDYDLIHAHSSRAGFLARILSVVPPHRCRVVYSPHGLSFTRTDFTVLTRTVCRALEQIALIGGRDLILVSQSEESVARDGLPGARTHVLENVVDTDALVPRPELQGRSCASLGAEEGPRALDIVHVGRLSTSKRPDLFAAIAATMRSQQAVRCAFTWIGEGDRGLLGAESGEVEVTGWLNAAEMHARLARASVVLFTSAGEGMPVAILEAQSLGVPVVGSDVVGVRDLIDHGSSGLLFTTMEQACVGLNEMSDPKKRAELAAAARDRVVEEHSVRGLALRSLNLYSAVTAEDGIEQESRQYP